MGKQKHDPGNKKRAARALAKVRPKHPDTKALAWLLVHRGLCSVHIIENSANVRSHQ